MKAGTVWTLGLCLKVDCRIIILQKKDATKAGWKSAKFNLAEVCPGKIIGNVLYKNKEGKLPSAANRIWYEADFDYSDDTRGSNRIFYSNDGLIFISYDHAKTFYELVKRGD